VVNLCYYILPVWVQALPLPVPLTHPVIARIPPHTHKVRRVRERERERESTLQSG